MTSIPRPVASASEGRLASGKQIDGRPWSCAECGRPENLARLDVEGNCPACAREHRACRAAIRLIDAGIAVTREAVV